MTFLKLISENGWWAYHDNSQMYHYVVYLSEEKDVYKYHLIDDDRNEIYKPSPKDIVYEEFNI